MYYSEYFVPLTERHTRAREEKFVIIENEKIKYAKFRGIIATGRVYKKEHQKGFLTFLTISYEDGKYVDLILYGIHKVSKMSFVSGYGKLKDDGYCKYVDVIKFNKF